ncbi:hypothetical protein [Lysobacter sp. Hz 25]|uniref:hypothetical protein n=1 Tax=Lysobacter sp. Hz 25 TaxID=3383698 RepID=UPI0038D4643E
MALSPHSATITITTPAVRPSRMWRHAPLRREELADQRVARAEDLQHHVDPQQHRNHAQHEAQGRGRAEQQLDDRAEQADEAQQRDQGAAEIDQRVVEQVAEQAEQRQQGQRQHRRGEVVEQGQPGEAMLESRPDPADDQRRCEHAAHDHEQGREQVGGIGDDRQRIGDDLGQLRIGFQRRRSGGGRGCGHGRGARLSPWVP